MTTIDDPARFPAEQTVSAWARLVRTQTRVLDEVQQALKAAGLPVLAWYDVLYELHKAGGDGLRQFEVAERTLITKYNLSRLIQKLQREGLVHVASCPEDGRGHCVCITQQGSELLRAMWPVYAAVIRERFENTLSISEVRKLNELLIKLEKNSWS